MRSKTLTPIFFVLACFDWCPGFPNDFVPAKPNMLTQKQHESLLIRLRGEIMLWEIVPVASEVPTRSTFIDIRYEEK